MGSDSIYAVAPGGTERWRFPFTGSPDSVALGADGTISVLAHMATGDGHLCALRTNGSLKWEFAAPRSACGEQADFNQMNDPTVAPDGTLLASACPAVLNENHPEGADMLVLYALKPDGTLKRQLSEDALMGLEAKGFGSDGDVYVEEDWGFYGGDLVAISPEGKQRRSLGRGRFDLAFAADGTIYVADNIDSENGVCPSGTLYGCTPSGDLKWRLEELCVRNLDGCPGSQ